MEVIENKVFDEERALYGKSGLWVRGCSFDGPADGESALKESSDIVFSGGFCNLRYPFWHVNKLKIEDTVMTELCRAALWYSENINIAGCRMHGIKALRECRDVCIENSDIVSPEFGWSVDGIKMKDTVVQSEYFMMRSRNINFDNVRLRGKYSFQYIEDAAFENCNFDTKDAFWHGKNIIVKNSVVKGEYLGWYSENVTFENCTIIGTQPLCYCKGLKLIDCKMENADLCFEKSDVTANIIGEVISIKNPLSGRIAAAGAGEIIMDEEWAKGEVVIE